MAKNETQPQSYTMHKINSKYIKDLNVRSENRTILKDNIGGKLLNISLGDDFFTLTSRAKATKAKINKWGYIILKIFCTAEETINKMTRNLNKWEKIIAHQISDKGLIFKIYKELIKLNSKNRNKNNK